ncbi:MAG TPA: sigma-54 dependent transcriptional regulator, partial [Terriglobales bacterium]|nr:sigma-54 dependent transcriptional regulator [Terriglobales bacterium]
GATILVADDDRAIRMVLNQALARLGYDVRMTGNAATLWRWVADGEGDLVITDVIMPDENGLDLIPRIKKLRPDLRVIVMSAQSTLLTAVKATERGAFEYLPKPFDLRELVNVVERALTAPNAQSAAEAEPADEQLPLIGRSPAMQEIYRVLARLMGTDLTVMITGESGTGKELVARAAHVCSPRASEPFVSVNCGAFPETLLESELFGYVKGAFTGAAQNKRGLFEVADGGTIFLDEISEMTMAMQVKLLRVLQERTIRPVGGTNEIPIDVRVISATNRDLDKLVSENAFREDLYYRLSVIPVKVAPLRERPEDIPLLANHFLKKYSPAAGKSILRIDPLSLQALAGYEWPGNVRQLENAIERAVALETGNELHVELPAERPKAKAAAAAVGAGSSTTVAVAGTNGFGESLPGDGLDMENYVANIERTLLQSALRQSNGVQTRAAEMLKLSYRSFRHLMKKYDI